MMQVAVAGKVIAHTKKKEKNTTNGESDADRTQTYRCDACRQARGIVLYPLIIG